MPADLAVDAARLQRRFRCYRTELLAQIDFAQIRSRGYSFQEEILWHLKSLGGRIRRSPSRSWIANEAPQRSA